MTCGNTSHESETCNKKALRGILWNDEFADALSYAALIN